jgi:ubiquinone/menaquinone biosynthesis C-methylase UbiE
LKSDRETASLLAADELEHYAAIRNIMTISHNDGVREQYADDRSLNVRINLHKLYSTNKQGWTSWLYHQMTFPKNSQVLELGCGNGQLWFDNEKKIPADVTFIISDFSEGMLTTARERMVNIAGSFEFLVLDAQKIPLEDESIDICIANHMLYHVPDINVALSEIKRILKKEGTFYSTTVGKRHLAEIRELLISLDEKIYWNSASQGIYTLQSGPQILGKYFADIEIRIYEDSLEITDDEDLIQYILSSTGISNVVSHLQGNSQDKLRKRLQQDIMNNGHIKVSKESGIFIAV